jgi:hypothetical protein
MDGAKADGRLKLKRLSRRLQGQSSRAGRRHRGCLGVAAPTDQSRCVTYLASDFSAVKLNMDWLQERILRQLALAGPPTADELVRRLNARQWTDLCTPLAQLVARGHATVVGPLGNRKPAIASTRAAAPHSAPITDRGLAPGIRSGGGIYSR